MNIPARRGSSSSGFTLIELLVVVAIISALAITVFVALNPAKRLADTRNSRRAQDANQILTGIFECIVDNDTSDMSLCVGSYNNGETYEIVTGSTSSGCDDVCTIVTSDTHCLPLDATLSDYFVDIPVDPGGAAAGHTEYAMTLYDTGMVVIEACSAEGQTIKVGR